MDDVFAVQDEIANSVVEKLKVKLLREEGAPVITRQANNLEAYNLVLKGRYFFSIETARLIERFTLVDPDTLRYEVTFEDPVNLLRPWTAMLAMPRTEGPMFEYACHEGNYGMTGILEIARGEGTPRADSR